ncbi:hypothetical protein BJ165DRAFT_1591757 [Panaeolus papilionaceus]|nr:hypothetical protein BJ165DRAFT_1591757 [Panaeolus papilionaceus]
MSLTKLSPEVLLCIMVHLKPEGAINLGKTCRVFRKLNKDRMLWRQLAYQMCLANGILIPHDLHKLSLKELIYMATGPCRILRLLQSNRQPDQSGPDDADKYLVPKRITKLFSQNDVFFKQMFLVPGGRYMLTLASDDVFCFWDLKVSPRKHPVHLKNWTHAAKRCTILTFVPTADQKGLRVVVGCLMNGFNLTLTVYELTFNNNGKLDVTSVDATFDGNNDDDEEEIDIEHCAMVGSRVVYLSNSMITMWDYKCNKFARWNYRHLYDDECREVIIDGDRFWALCEHVLLGWTIPELRDMETCRSQPAEMMVPELAIPIQTPSKSFDEFSLKHDPSWMSSQDWYTNLRTPLDSFDIIWTENGKDQLSTYPLSRIYINRLLTLPIEPIYTKSISLTTQFYSAQRDCDYMMHCNDYFVKPLYAFKDHTVHLVVSPRPDSRTGGLENFRAVLSLGLESVWEEEIYRRIEFPQLHVWMRSHFFDPVGGRACLIKAGHSGIVLVCDYLEP